MKELNEDERTKQELLYKCSCLVSRISDEIIKNETLQRELYKANEKLEKIEEYIDSNDFRTCFADMFSEAKIKYIIRNLIKEEQITKVID